MKCSICQAEELYEAEVGSQGGQGPDLLPGTGIFTHAKFTLMVCGKCGHVHWFVRGKNLQKVVDSDYFARVSSSDAGQPGEASPPLREISEQLEELQRQRSESLITEDEYAERRQQILRQAGL